MKRISPIFLLIVFLLPWSSALSAKAVEVGKELDAVGVFYELSDGNFLNVRVEDFHFKVIFTDKDKLVIEPIYSSLTVKFDGIINKRDDGYYPLSRSGNFLTSPRRLKKPFQYWIQLHIKDPKVPDGKLILPRKRLQQ